MAEIGYVIGDVKGKTAVLVDDMIDTAGTLRAAAQTVLDEGASRVYAAATHPILSGNAYENLAAAGFEQIVVTDTIPMRAGAPDNLRVLSCAELLTDSIRRIFTDDQCQRGLRRREPALLISRSRSPRRRRPRPPCSWTASASPRTSCAPCSTPTR